MNHIVTEHFVGRFPHVREIYDLIVAAAGEIGPVKVDPNKSSIHLNRRSASADVATRRKNLILTVKTTTAIDDARIGWLKDLYEISG